MTFVNLNEAGGLANAGQGYDANAEDHAGSAKSFQGKMESSQQSLIGSAGSTFRGVSDTAAGNHLQLAQRIAEQAYRAVHADNRIQTGDQEGHSVQTSTQSAVDSTTGLVSRQINV